MAGRREEIRRFQEEGNVQKARPHDDNHRYVLLDAKRKSQMSENPRSKSTS